MLGSIRFGVGRLSSISFRDSNSSVCCAAFKIVVHKSVKATREIAKQFVKICLQVNSISFHKLSHVARNAVLAVSQRPYPPCMTNQYGVNNSRLSQNFVCKAHCGFRRITSSESKTFLVEGWKLTTRATQLKCLDSPTEEQLVLG